MCTYVHCTYVHKIYMCKQICICTYVHHIYIYIYTCIHVYSIHNIHDVSYYICMCKISYSVYMRVCVRGSHPSLVLQECRTRLGREMLSCTIARQPRKVTMAQTTSTNMVGVVGVVRGLEHHPPSPLPLRLPSPHPFPN